MAQLAIQEQAIDEPRIYVACLAAYNTGHLHGAWISAAQEAWTIWDEVKAMLEASPIAGAEEYAIHDYDGFEDVCIKEYTSLDTVSRLAAFIAEHGELGAQLISHFSGDMDEAEEAIKDQYLGCYANLADYIEEVIEETTSIPSNLQYYIDWKVMARDVEINGGVFTIRTGHELVHVFTAR